MLSNPLFKKNVHMQKHPREVDKCRDSIHVMYNVAVHFVSNEYPLINDTDGANVCQRTSFHAKIMAMFNIIDKKLRYRNNLAMKKRLMWKVHAPECTFVTVLAIDLIWKRAFMVRGVTLPLSQRFLCRLATCSRLTSWHENAFSITGPLFTKKTPSYQYRDSQYKPETVIRPS